MKEKIEKFARVADKYFLVVLVSLFVLQLGNFFSVYLFHESYLSVGSLLFVLQLLAFLFLKDFASEDQKKIGFRLFKFSLFLFAATVINDVFMQMANVLGSKNPEKGEALFRLSYFFIFGLAVGSMAFFRNEQVQELFRNMYEQSIYEKLKIKIAGEEKKLGDVQLCIDVETNKPVILKQKDRFLHMLILGPTGAGKTSQIILPMLNQDMQDPENGITILEPKGDLAEKAYAMAKYYGRKAIYFNPVYPNCPYFNPLHGDEDDVIENMVMTFKTMDTESPQFFQDMNEMLIRNSLKVLKRLYGNDATFIDLYRLVYNINGMGRKMVLEFSKMKTPSEEVAKENADLVAWFLNDYLKEGSKTYEHCSGVRNQISKIVSNKYLRRVLNPPKGQNDIDFDKHLAEGGVISISTAQGSLRDLGRFLGFFIMLQFQTAVMRRPGNERTRRPHFIYIDEFQTYANPGFSEILTQGRSYRVATHLATQNRALIGMGHGQLGKDFIELVSANARNLVIFPGGNAIDAKYYSEQFGEIIKREVQKSVSRQKFNPLKGFKPMSYDSETVRVVEKKESRFSPGDIIYRPFGEITYCIIKDNSIQTPGVGRIQYIPKELDDKLNEMVDELQKQLVVEKEKEKLFEAQPVGLEKVIQDEPVVANIPKPTDHQKEKEFLHKGKEIVDPNEEYIDDIVIEAEEQKEKRKGDFDFESEIEDDLI